MKQFLLALQAEVLKNKHSSIFPATILAFGLAPLMGGIFVLLLDSPEAMARAGGLAAKTKAINFQRTWESYLSICTQALGVGGILVFGFVNSWIFGREYAEGTAKDLLSLPVSRTHILNAKFVVYILWCSLLAITNLLVACLIGILLRLPSIPITSLFQFLQEYSITLALTVLTGTPIALFAMGGKGYLAPLGFVALALVLAQIMSAIGYGTYFPWAIPGLYSGAGGEYKELLNVWSYLILFFLTCLGYLLTIVYWNKADHTK